MGVSFLVVVLPREPEVELEKRVPVFSGSSSGAPAPNGSLNGALRQTGCLSLLVISLGVFR